VFHQASAFMLKTVARAAKIPPAKLILGFENYGNVSVASIPVAMNDQMSATLSREPKRLVLAGFGIGWSWAAAALECGPMVISPVATMPDVHVEPEF
jgi:3-oxoacyl-[acyl-carrier-protein] synthase-3